MNLLVNCHGKRKYKLNLRGLTMLPEMLISCKANLYCVYTVSYKVCCGTVLILAWLYLLPGDFLNLFLDIFNMC